jgi:hypothetical protein
MLSSIIKTTFIPASIIQKNDFFLDESDEELNPCYTRNENMDRLYHYSKCRFFWRLDPINSTTILLGSTGDFYVDSDKHVIRFIKFYKDEFGKNQFPEIEFDTSQVNCGKYINFAHSRFHERKFDFDWNKTVLDKSSQPALDYSLTGLVPQSNWWFYIRGELLESIAELNNLSIEKIKNNDTLEEIYCCIVTNKATLCINKPLEHDLNYLVLFR